MTLKNELVTALRRGGFAAAPLGVTASQYFAVRGDPTAPIHLRLDGWCQDWPSANTIIPPLLSSTEGYNLGFFQEKQIDDEIERIRLLPLDEQPAAWADLDELIQTEYYPVIVGGYPGTALLHGSRIGGMNLDSAGGMPTWEDIYVIR